MGAIGHPGDIERLRMAAIELASAEGFTRSAADVSLRRLAHYSLAGIENGVRAGLRRALPRAPPFRGNRPHAGNGFVSPFGVRRRHRDEQRELCADQAGFWRDQRDTAVDRAHGNIPAREHSAGATF